MAVLAMLLSLFGLEANFCSPPGLPRNRANRISRSPTSASVIDVAGRCNAANVRNPPIGTDTPSCVGVLARLIGSPDFSISSFTIPSFHLARASRSRPRPGRDPDSRVAARLAGRSICKGGSGACRMQNIPPLPFANLGLVRLFDIQPPKGSAYACVPPSGIRKKSERPRVSADPVRHVGRLSSGGWSPASSDRSQSRCPMQMLPLSPPASPPL